MKPIITLCIAAFTLCPSAFACSWIPTSFCETSNDRPEDVVISGKVISVDDDGIDVEVLHVLQGTESREVIRIFKPSQGLPSSATLRPPPLPWICDPCSL